MPKLTVNGIEVEVPAGATVLQACEAVGVEIPRFCYHERLSIAGNCRMCLVEVSPGPPKPQASCALPAGENMVVKTNSPMVKKAREGVMELLLINHPLDCPICDQGGECDLQDQAMAYGQGLGRYIEHKRAVPEKDIGPLIETFMNRCIHCTRCVRFSEEIAGIEEMGATGRGEHTEIGTYIAKAVSSELSGNMIDLCPVGALTNKPAEFRYRSWELTKTESIDVLDAVGSNIRIDARGREVIRILPRLNEDVNEEWISDKTRFACDGLKLQRLDRPMVRKDGKLQAVSWNEAFAAIAEKVKAVKPEQVAAIAGDLADCESMFALKDLVQNLGSANLDCRQDGAALDSTSRAGYLFNTTIAGIEQADACLLIGTNPRKEAPLVAARLRKRFRKGGFKVANIGEATDQTYKIDQLGNRPGLLKDIAEGKHPFAEVLKNAKNPMLILGAGALTREDGAALLHLARAAAEKLNMVRQDWNGFNVLHTAASRVGGLDIGFVPGAKGRDTRGILAGAKSGDIRLLFLLGSDEVPMSQLGEAFVVYQGHHGDHGAHRADVILPGTAYTEKDGTYVNMEGRVQRAYAAVTPPGDAREDWKILRALSEVVGKTLGYNTLEQLRQTMAAKTPHLTARVDVITPASWGVFGTAGNLQDAPFTATVADFYMTDPISRASKTMAKCSALFSASEKRKAA
ncbi:MAG: NADH-quinone oxidoreductase subunit G [Alphaproteobacteria bacterium]|nr:NADH-quinone oxidoreductase subunit G [Alphaproteobacteria bacterium]